MESRCKCGVSSSEFDELVTNLSDHPKSVVLLLTDKMKIPKTNYHLFNNFHQVFAGGGLPMIDDSFKTFTLPDTNISVHWIFCISTRFNQYVPLSTGCFDIKFHKIKVLPEFVDVINNAVSKKGLFPSRSRARNLGSCSYLGERAENSQNIPSPSEGPSEHGRWYYRQYINHIYWPFVLRLYNRLGCAASRLDWYIYKHLAVLYPWNNTSSSKIRYCRLLIATIDYECCNHCDMLDDVSQTEKDDMLSKLQVICQEKELESSLVNYAKNSMNFVSHWGVSIPTTCCYQFIIPEKLQEEQLQCIQFFLLTGLGICYPIKDYWLHCFTASNFIHCTSTPLFRIGGKVYVKRPEGVHIFAWGKSGPSKQKPKKYSNRETMEKMNMNSSGEVAGDGFGVSTNFHECGEVGGEFVGGGNCGGTISDNGGEVESREELREVRDEEFIYENSPDDHHGEVESGDIAEKLKEEVTEKLRLVLKKQLGV